MRAALGTRLVAFLSVLLVSLCMDCALAQGLIAFASARGSRTDIYTIRPDGTGLRRIIVNGQDPSFIPGTAGSLVFARGRSIYSADRNGGGIRRLARVQSRILVSNPMLSEDRSILLFNATTPGRNPVTSIRLFRMDRSGMQTIAASGWDPSFTPDQVRILFARGSTIYGMSRNSMAGPPYTPGVTWRVAGNAKARYPITGSGAFTGIVFAAHPNVPGATWSIRAILYGEEQPHEVVLASNAGQPTLSPDGRFIAFVRNGDIYTIRTDGSGSRRLTRNAGIVSRPTWWIPPERRAGNRSEFRASGQRP